MAKLGVGVVFIVAALASASPAVAGPVEPFDPARPDILGSESPGGPFAGDDEYNPGDPVLHVGKSGGPGDMRNYFVKVENDGGLPGTFKVRLLRPKNPDSPPPNLDVKFRLYRGFEGDRDVTRKAKKGKLKMLIQSDGVKNFRVQAIVKSADDPGFAFAALQATYRSPTGTQDSSDAVVLNLNAP